MILYNRVPKVAMIFGELLKAFLKTKRRREGEKKTLEMNLEVQK